MMQYDPYRSGDAKAAEFERATYFDTLMKSSELGERLITNREPVGKHYFYRVSDPTILELLELPTELTADDRVMTGVVFEVEEKTEEDGAAFASSFLSIEFDDESLCRIALPDKPMAEVEYDFVPPQPAHPEGTPLTEADLIEPLRGDITIGMLSALISRIAVPRIDPLFTDFRLLNTPDKRREIMDFLENRDFTQIDKVRFFELDGHKITVTSSNERITEIGITQLGIPDDGYEIALRTTLDQHRHSQELFVSDSNGRKSVPPYPEEIRAFGDTLTFLLEQLKPQEASLEAEQDAELLRSSRRLPEEKD